ncbi:hypothetical protein G6F59_017348 [Rhizopus arrhizus]|nr:hypothetical protein G6F59_017348 [Rhizopus arrhizus]
MDQVQVDVQHGGRAVGFGNHHVGVPQFVVQGAGCGSHACAWQKYEGADIGKDNERIMSAATGEYPQPHVVGQRLAGGVARQIGQQRGGGLAHGGADLGGQIVQQRRSEYPQPSGHAGR